MAIGAAKLVNERLNKLEMGAIGLIICAAILLTLSNLTVNITQVNLIDAGFLGREYIFTGVFIIIIIFCELIQRRIQRIRSILFAIESGSFLVLANYWISPVSGNVMHLFAGTVSLPWELITGILGAIILVLANVFSIGALQNGFKSGNANTVIPIQQVPVNIAPIFIYFSIFGKTTPSTYSVTLMLIAIVLIIISSYILAKRQIQLDAIK